MNRKNEMSLGEAIEAYLQKHGLKEQQLVHKVIGDWARIMGKPVAENTDRIWFQDGVFYIRMVNPVWRNELNMGKSLIAKRLNDEMQQDLIKEVRIL